MIDCPAQYGQFDGYSRFVPKGCFDAGAFVFVEFAVDIGEKGAGIGRSFELGFEECIPVGEDQMGIGGYPALQQGFPFFAKFGVFGNKTLHRMSFFRRQFVVRIQQKELFVIISRDHRL